MTESKEYHYDDSNRNEKTKNFFWKARNKTKLFSSFGSDTEFIIEDIKNRFNQYPKFDKNLYFKIVKHKVYQIVNCFYVLIIIFNKDLLYLLVDKKYDGLSNFFQTILIGYSLIEIFVNIYMERNYFYYFLFFDFLSIIILLFDLSTYESNLFYFFNSIINSIGWKLKIEDDEIFHLVHLFKVLITIKIYRVIVNFIISFVKDEYKNMHRKSLEKLKTINPKAEKTNIKEKLTFTKKMHIALIKRYFTSLVFIMFSIILLEIVSVSQENHGSMDYAMHHLDLIHLDESRENELLRALYFYSHIKKKRKDPEYLIAVKMRFRFHSFVEKMEMNVKGELVILWDFSKLAEHELNKLKRKRKDNIGEQTEDIIMLDNTVKDLNDLRYYEIKIWESQYFTFYINVKGILKKKIQRKIVLKIFVILFSVIILIYFTKELNILLFPIESILKKLKLMKINPNLALEMQEELLNCELKNIMEDRKLKRNSAKENYEIIKMEENLMKLGTLMLLGFGEAGAKMISKNINEQERINLLTNGEIVYSVFSFCDIRNFTEITEVLKEKIMIFINLVSEIIHDSCDFHGGTINKNIGDAFLLVWKCKKKHISRKYDLDELNTADENILSNFANNQHINRICDLAFLSTVQTLIKLQQSVEINEFLKSKLFDENLLTKKYLELSFGLHFGWAIEGPIGSRYKIDLSYLSENVNIASRLQDISKIYKTNIVISEQFFRNMSECFRKSLRHIDKVTLKGCANPINLYTFDSCLDKLQPKKIEQMEMELPHFEKKMIKIMNDIKKKEERRSRKKKINNLNYNLYEEYKKNKEIKLIKIEYPTEYKNSFEEALQLYLNGKWNESKSILNTLENKYSYHDTIVEQLNQFMQQTNFIPPKNWCGYRQFKQKS